LKSSTKFSPIIGLIFGILAVSTASLFIRFAQKEAPSLVIAAGRMGIATLLLTPFALRQSIEEIKKINKRMLFFLVLAGLFLGLHFATWITSLEYTSVASSVVLVTTAPLWVALLSPIFLKEKLSIWIFLGLAVSLLGSIIVGMNGVCKWQNEGLSCVQISSMFQGRAFWGNLLALLGAFLSGGYLMVGRRVRSQFTLLTYSYLVYGIAGLVLIVLVAISGQGIGSYSAGTWVWIALLAIVPQILGHSTFNYFLKYLSAAFVSIALLGEPVGTVILAYLFLRESPSVMEICGGILILAGIAVATRANRQKGEEPLIPAE
jgi:drug/metabolite transporter (DMT)-like permease